MLLPLLSLLTFCAGLGALCVPLLLLLLPQQVKSFKQGKTSLRGAVAVAVRNANNEAAAAASGGAAAGAGGGDAGKAAGGAGAIQGPVTRATRRGRRPREEEAAPVTKKRKGDKFIALAERNSAADWSLTSSLDGDSARDTYKCV